MMGAHLLLKQFGLDPESIKGEIEKTAKQVQATVAHFDARLGHLSDALSRVEDALARLEAASQGGGKRLPSEGPALLASLEHADLFGASPKGTQQ